MNKWSPSSVSRQAEYANIGSNTIRLIGPDGKLDSIASGSRVIRSDWYNKYVPGHLRFIRYVDAPSPRTAIRAMKPPPSAIKQKQRERHQSRIQEARKRVRSGQIRTITPPSPKSLNKQSISLQEPSQPGPKRKIVGKSLANAAEVYRAARTGNHIQVSNNIGVGILSYNRIDSLRRLVASIRSHTDLLKTTVFISDESDNISQEDSEWLDSLSDFVVIRDDRIGIAGNSNRLLRCLSRFQYKILLNDDTEVLANGWDAFYPEYIKKTGIHHFCYREPGVYGAQPGTPKTVRGHAVSVVHDKPHGAVMAFDDEAFKAVGYFDEGFGKYGMEHVDWSERVASATGIDGFYDAEGSNRFFKIHPQTSSVEDRTRYLQEAKARYARVKGTRSYVEPTINSEVPCISVVIPFRGQERVDDITTVINNMRGMKFPDVQIVVVEHDSNQKVSPQSMGPISYHFIHSTGLFNKSAAFNAGVKMSTNTNVVLHDADLVVKGSYLSDITALLEFYDGCHIGSKVHYMNEEGTRRFNHSGVLPDGNVSHVVGYFEGGSIACRKGTYYEIGGFDEAYEGYGCEDCCFFERLKNLSNFYDDRSYDLFHLFHGKSQDTDSRHGINKAYFHNMRKKYSLKDYAAFLASKIGK